ncbi:MAG: ATP-binding protein [Patescibacteria group bacterium]
MLFYLISSIVNTVTSIILGTFVYFQNRRSNTNKYFGLFAFSVAFWSTGYFFWHLAPEQNAALFWLRMLMAGAVFVPIFYFHFIASLLDLTKKIKSFLWFGYISAFIFLFFNFFTPYFIKSTSPKLFFPFWPEPGIVFHIFLLIFFLYTFYSWYLLLSASKKATGILKDQILYVFWGTFIAFLGGSTNYFLWYNIPVPPAGNWSVAIYIGMIAYAIVRKKLFNIKIVLTELLVGIIIILLFINIFTSQSSFEYIWKGSLLFAFIIFGYLLIKSVINEIRRRQEMEELTDELKGAYAELKKLDNAKSEFISIASHQLRAPLTAIKGYISMILDKTYGEIPESIIKAVTNMGLSNERLIKLVNDLLSISRIEAGRMEIKMENISVEDIIASVVDELKNIVKEKGLYLKFEKPKTALPKILIDGDKMRQVILNLIDNAIKYTSNGGITIKLEIPALPAGRENLKLEIAVSDTGEGMTREEISKVFRSFTRGSAGRKLSAEGAGLGLYIAKKFIEMHNGKIWAESKGRGKGSVFYIKLPVR